MKYSKKEIKKLENFLPGVVLKVALSSVFSDGFDSRYADIARKSLWDKFRSLFYHEDSFNISVRTFESRLYETDNIGIFYKNFYFCYSYDDISGFEPSEYLEEFLE